MVKILKKRKKKGKKKVRKSKIPGVTFFREVSLELQRTEWPSPKEILRLSILVLISASLLGTVLYFLDILFQRILGLMI